MHPFHGFVRRSGDVPLGQFVMPGKFGRMFPKLAPLTASPDVLTQLANAMVDNDSDNPAGDNTDVPAGYTYLGQFVDHDITFDTTSLKETLVDPMAIRNFRSPALDLDCLYGSGPAVQPYLFQRPPNNDLFVIGRTRGIPGAGDPTVPISLPFDLPRGPSGSALIGDPRNDENLIVAQLHLAFLRFHNKVVAGIRDGTIPQESPLRKSPFEEARDLVVWHYQWIVLHDFLRRILDAAELNRILKRGSMLFQCGGCEGEPFIPVEFSVAAYRLGHSMVRAVYDYNRVFTPRPGGVAPASLELLFRFSGLSGGDVPIPSDWIIDWRRFFEVGTGATVGFSRRLDPFLARPLHNLPNVPPPNSLAARNLLRGNSLGLPPAQSICRFLGIKPLTRSEIGSGPDGSIARSHKLDVETPLWYYILKEAEVQQNARKLGELGSRIVAEVFVGLLERDAGSFIARKPTWKPSLPAQVQGTFTMADLLNFVGDLNPLG